MITASRVERRFGILSNSIRYLYHKRCDLPGRQFEDIVPDPWRAGSFLCWTGCRKSGFSVSGHGSGCYGRPGREIGKTSKFLSQVGLIHTEDLLCRAVDILEYVFAAAVVGS